MGTPADAGQRQQVEFIHQTWPAQARQLASIRAAVRRCLATLSLTEEARQDLVLAVSEAATNAIEHAYRPATADDTVELTFWTEAHTVCIEILDHGWWQTPSTQPTGRGLGIPIMHRLVQSVVIHYDARGTRVVLSHPLPGEALALPRGGDRPTSPQIQPTDSGQRRATPNTPSSSSGRVGRRRRSP